jgi:hypothetical protein
MWVPNLGRELSELSVRSDPRASHQARKGNPVPLYRDDELPADDLRAASARANVVTQRLGGVRHALTRRTMPPLGSEQAPGGEPDPHA